jgi:hypothetical protein
MQLAGNQGPDRGGPLLGANPERHHVLLDDPDVDALKPAAASFQPRQEVSQAQRVRPSRVGRPSPSSQRLEELPDLWHSRPVGGDHDERHRHVVLTDDHEGGHGNPLPAHQHHRNRSGESRGFPRQDIAQTDGDGVQPPERPKLLEGEAPAGLWDTLASEVQRAGYTLTRAEIGSGANGVTNFASRTVTIAPHLSAAQAVKTLAHELAHVTMHNGSEYAAGCRGQTEIEAESVAYILCHTAGLTTAGYSLGYVAHWAGGDPQAVKETAERVVTTARTILDRLGLHAEPTSSPEAVAA